MTRSKGSVGEALRLKHAIAPPLFGKGKLHRSRLVDRLLGDLDKKLIVIAAPAGYGKTTLVADFAMHVELPVCWIRLFPGISETADLAQALRLSLNVRFRRLAGRPGLKGLSGVGPRGLAGIFADLIESEIQGQFVLAIDDVHEANDSAELLAFFDEFIDRQPSNLTTIVAGREPPQISLAKLMANGALGGLGPHDLALTRDEAVGILSPTHGGDDLEKVAEALIEQTKGWITGILLSNEVLHKVGSAAISGGQPLVFDYLATVVFNRLPEEMRTFLREASVLRIMTAKACDAVLVRKDSSRLLARLLQSGLFVTESEGEQRTYEFHPLFREFLRAQLTSIDARRGSALIRRAADYLAAGGAVEDAVHLFIEAGEIGRARAIAEADSERAFREGRINTLEEWDAALAQHGHPSITVLTLLAQGYADRGNIESSEGALQRIDSIPPKKAKRQTVAQIETVRGLIAFRKGMYKEAEAAGSLAERLLARTRKGHIHRGMAKRLRALAMAAGDEELVKVVAIAKDAVQDLDKAGDPYALAQGLVDLHSFQVQGGDQLGAIQSIERAHRLLLPIGAPVPLAMVVGNLAVVNHLRGRYEQSMAEFDRGLTLARLCASSLVEGQLLLSQAELFTDLGMNLQAGQVFQSALEIASRIGDIELLAYGCLGASNLHRRAGNRALAQEWVTRALEFAKAYERLKSSAVIQKAMLQVPTAPKEASEILSRVLDEARPKAELRDQVTAFLYLGFAQSLLGNRVSSVRGFAMSLQIAVSSGLEQVFASELAWNDVLFKEILRVSPAPHGLVAIGERMELMKAVGRRYQPKAESEPLPPHLLVRAFGRGVVMLHGSNLSGLKPLHRQILFYILDNEQAPKESIVEEFWPNAETGRKAANLHMAIYSLRRALGKTSIAFDGSRYSLVEELKTEYDVAKFEKAALVASHLAPGDPRKYFALTEAAGLYGGEFLVGDGSNWARARRGSLDATFTRIAEAYAEEAVQRGNRPSAIEVLRRALDVDPYNDNLNLKYLELLGGMGRRTDVVSHYARYVRLLGDELGLEPPATLREAYDRLIS
ncbi:MAG: BTAD domain-containing putative transcriptional regulator [Anaerolineales bacterium]